MTREQAKREIDSLDYYLQNHTDDYSEESHTAMMMAISALSENKGEWIPVSERLPEDYDRVLITVNGCRGLIVREARYCKAQNEFEVLHNHERWEVGEKGLLAWMPLPSPWKGE